MAITSVLQRRASQGGGQKGSAIGGILGTVGALVAAPFTGGASLAALPATIGIGSTAGGIVGGAVDPARAAANGPQVQDSAASRRLASPEPDHSTVLEDSLKALHESGDKNLQETYGAPLYEAYTMSKKGRLA